VHVRSIFTLGHLKSTHGVTRQERILTPFLDAFNLEVRVGVVVMIRVHIEEPELLKISRP